MSMEKNRLGGSIRTKVLAVLNKVDFGAKLKSKIMAVVNTLNQNSDPANADTYQTTLYQEMAQAVIEETLGNTAVCTAIAEAVIDELSVYAQLDSLLCDEQELFAGQGPHKHSVNVVTTAAQVGKIS